MKIKEKKKISVLRKLLILLSVILLLFGGLNFIWYCGVKLKYESYAKKLEVVIDGSYTSYEKAEGEYLYKLKMPGYLDFESFLSVGDIEGYVMETNEEGDIISSSGLNITLFIWPDIFGRYEYGVQFMDEVQNIWEQVMITEDLKLIPQDKKNEEMNTYLNKLISDNYDEINNMMQGAKKFWGF